MIHPPASQSVCYHCHSKPPNRHSNFCDECLAAHRPLYFPEPKQPIPLMTVLLWIGAVAATGWLIYKTVEVLLG